MNAAGAGDSAARSALGKLCETYWYPLYAYVRRGGATPDDARDLTQGFFTSLIERRDFDSLQKERGRFRAFLLASLQHYLANDFARRRTLKRGGGMLPLSLEFDGAEGRYRFEPMEKETPQTLFERRWALTVIEKALAQVRREWEAAAKTAEFEALKSCLLGGTPSRRIRSRGEGHLQHRGRGPRGRPPAAPQVPEAAAGGDRRDGCRPVRSRRRNPIPLARPGRVMSRNVHRPFFLFLVWRLRTRNNPDNAHAAENRYRRTRRRAFVPLAWSLPAWKPSPAPSMMRPPWFPWRPPQGRPVQANLG